MDKDYETDWLLFDATEDRWRDEPTEPSTEWDVENYAASVSNWLNGEGHWGQRDTEYPAYMADLTNRQAATANLPFGKDNWS